VAFTASYGIVLKTGFSELQGSQFLAQLEGCNQEMDPPQRTGLAAAANMPTKESRSGQILVAPNPVIGQARIRVFNPQAGPIRLDLSNSSGQQMMSLSLPGNKHGGTA
jgi:hypothetical protein